MAVVRAVLPYRQDEDDLPQRTAGHSMGGSGRLRAGAGSGREAREHGASVAYRRFPALAQFTDEELAAITMPPQPFPGMTPSPSVAQLGGRSVACMRSLASPCTSAQARIYARAQQLTLPRAPLARPATPTCAQRRVGQR